MSGWSPRVTPVTMSPIQPPVPWRWVCRALWWAAVGAMASLLLMGAMIWRGQGYCEYECSLQGWLNPMSPRSRTYINHLIRDVIKPQQDHPPHPLNELEIRNVLKHDDCSFTVYQFMMDCLKDIKTGTFIEIGAGDGVFLSLTIQLELLHGWQGLLVEPRVEPFNNIRARRKAAAANVCVAGGDYHAKELLWMPNVQEGLPPLLNKITKSRAVLQRYVPEEDLADGVSVVTQCYTLEALITAYQKMNNRSTDPIELLLINTNAGELSMLEQLAVKRYMMVVTQVRNSHEETRIANQLKYFGLRQVHNDSIQYMIGFYLHNSVNL